MGFENEYYKLEEIIREYGEFYEQGHERKFPESDKEELEKILIEHAFPLIGLLNRPVDLHLLLECADGRKNTATGLLNVARSVRPESDDKELYDRDIQRIVECIDKNRCKYRKIGASRIETARKYLTVRGIK